MRRSAKGHSLLTRMMPRHDVAKADDEERLETLEFVWNNQIVPLLEEHFYAQREKLAQLLAPFLANEEADVEGDAIARGLHIKSAAGVL